MSSSIPPNLKYSDTHEWLRVEGHQGLVGLTAHAIELLGEIVYLELPHVGDHYEAHAEIGLIESVKAATDLYTPVSGKIIEVNAALAANPGLLNKEAYQNWLYRIEFSHLVELDSLMTAETYSAAIR